MVIKRNQHHDLATVQAKFATVDTYNLPWDDRWLYLKFAGETLINVTLTSFKEAGHG